MKEKNEPILSHVLEKESVTSKKLWGVQSSVSLQTQETSPYFLPLCLSYTAYDWNLFLKRLLNVQVRVARQKTCTRRKDRGPVSSR